MTNEQQEAQAINQADAFTTLSLAVIEAQRTLLGIGAKIEQLQNVVAALNNGAGNRLKVLEDIVLPTLTQQAKETGRSAASRPTAAEMVAKVMAQTGGTQDTEKPEQRNG